MKTCHQPMARRFDHLAGKKRKNAGLLLKTIAYRYISPLWQVKIKKV